VRLKITKKQCNYDQITVHLNAPSCELCQCTYNAPIWKICYTRVFKSKPCRVRLVHFLGLSVHNLADNIDEMASLGIVLATNSGNYFNSDLTLFWYKAFCKVSLICDNSANCCIIIGFKFVILSITLVDLPR